MACTTILVGKKASNDGSTMIARNDDGHFDIKKLVVVEPKNQPKKYKSKIGHLEIDLPENPVQYTSTPSVDLSEGIWAANGINAHNVAMTATETITANSRVLGADPFVEYKKATKRTEKDIAGGIGEEDLVVLVLPYIKSAREGVLRLGELLKKYGTYESNGIAFSDENEIWWMETIGGHHWIAKRVPDDMCVIMPNQFGLDNFDFEDAYGKKEMNLCSSDLIEFVEKYHLNLDFSGSFNPRHVFGTHTDSDHIYNTPRAWFMGRCLNSKDYVWDGENADFTPESDDIPWAIKPERKVTVEDVKYILSSYYQGTPYNPYLKGEREEKGKYRSIGINRTGVMAILQLRPNMPEQIKAVEWICFGSNTFNAILPVYAQVKKIPEFLSNVKKDISTENLYWQSRIISALADPYFGETIIEIERYQEQTFGMGQKLLNEFDEKFLEQNDALLLEKANKKICDEVKILTQKALKKVLDISSNKMKNGFHRWDN